MAIVNGFVALIDILGFQAFVRGRDFDDRVQRYLDRVDDIVTRSAPGIGYSQASDSTVLTIENQGVESLRSLLETVAAISFDALVEQDVAMRGGIASGPYAVVQDAGRAGSGVAGPAVVDAYLTEQKQDWVGTMLSPSLYDAIPNLPDLLTPPDNWPPTRAGHLELEARMDWLLLAARYLIPMHAEDPPIDGFAVLPKRLGTNTPEQIITDLKEYEQALGRRTLLATHGSVQRKYRASMLFCRDQAKFWGGLKSQQRWQTRHEPD